MSTAPAQSLLPQSQLHRFLGGAILGLVGLFVLLRLPSIQAAVLEPWSAVLADLAARALGVFGKEVTVSGTLLRTSSLSLNVTTDCSGLEVIGVYLALTLAYPAPWSRRLRGAVYSILLFQILNFLRIVGLFWVEAGPTFEFFHSYLWPLVLVIAGCVLWAVWLRKGTQTSDLSHSRPTQPTRLAAYRPVLCFGSVALVLLVLLPYVVESHFMYEFSVWVTNGSAWTLSALGVPAQANGCLLSSAPMSVNVLPRCTSTPLYILYLAAAISVPLAWAWRSMLLALAVPVFFVLNVSRVVSLVWTQANLPSISLFVGHFFFQISLITGLTLAFGWWLSQSLTKTEQRSFWLRLVLGSVGSLSVWWLLGGVYDSLISGGYQGIVSLSGGALSTQVPQDEYRILHLMPAFQLAILGAFAIACVWHWPWVLGCVSVLYISQLAFLLSVGTIRQLYGLEPHVRFFRAWVVAVPFVLVWAIARNFWIGDRPVQRGEDQKKPSRTARVLGIV